MQANAPVVSPKSMDSSRIVAVIFPGWAGTCPACPWTPLDSGARRCSRSAFAAVPHELGKPLRLFLLWLSHLRNTCHGWARLIGGINKGKWPRNPELRSADNTVLLLIAWFALSFWCGFTILPTAHQGKGCACVSGQLCSMCPGQSRECLFRVKK